MSGQADRAQQLALGALAAVEQQPVAAAAHENGRAGPRRAVGTEPAVPAKNSDRSIRPRA
jgi:hypothetical protein